MRTYYRVCWETALNSNIRDFDTFEEAKAFASVRGHTAQVIEVWY